MSEKITLQSAIEALNIIAKNEGEADPESAHDLSVIVLLQYLDQTDLHDLAEAYRMANRNFWGADGLRK